VAHPFLAKGRVFEGEVQDCFFDIFRDAVLEVRHAFALLCKGFNASILIRILHPVKRVVSGNVKGYQK
jgi:hypothetical protein